MSYLWLDGLNGRIKNKSVYKSYFFSYRTLGTNSFISLYNIANLLEFHSRHVLCNDTLNVCHSSDCAVFLSSMTETHFLISNPIAASIGGKTALPIYNRTSTLLQVTFRKSWKEVFILMTKFAVDCIISYYCFSKWFTKVL